MSKTIIRHLKKHNWYGQKLWDIFRTEHIQFKKEVA